MFRFSIRDVLWLTLVVALVVAWTVDRGMMVRRYEGMLKKLKEFNRPNPRRVVRDTS